MPHTIYSRKKFAGLIDNFEQLAECNSVYPVKERIDQPGVSKFCEHKPFPRSQRSNFVLLKTLNWLVEKE